MLDKRFRLRKQRDFENIFNGGMYLSDGFLALKSKSNNFGCSRFGFVVSNKISNIAAKRNRIKRIMREYIRINMPNLKEGFDCLFIAKKGIAEKNSKEIKECVDKLLKRSGLQMK